MNKYYSYFFLTAMLIILASSSLISCPGTTFGGRFNTIFPLGEESKYTKTSFGFDLYGGYSFPHCPFETGLNIRYINWSPKDTYPGQTVSNTSWDFNAYCDYLWDDDDDCDFEPYGGIQLGIHDWFSSYTYNYDGNTQTYKANGGNLAYDLHIGTYYELNKNIKLDLRLDYTGYTTKPTAQTGFGVGLGAKYIF
ncbi:MAG: hypothetical protein EPN82_05690 [Bacteroidetes bacterium]|nr:MAG: hypothetical protein EPN82_05690 [Bacteroidota bacterium]